MYTIRPIAPGDYAAATAIYNLNASEPVTVAVFSEWCELDPKRNIHYYHLVAEDASGRVVGTVITCYNQFLATDQWYMKVLVHPEARGRGAGSALYGAAERLARESGAREFLSEVRGDDERSRLWAERRGFQCTRERTESVMSLAEWDATPFADAVAKVEAMGLRFMTLREVEGEGLLRRLYDFESATIPDWPGFEPPFPPYEAWARLKVGEERDRTPKIWALAINAKLGYRLVPGPFRLKKVL
jgi:mycothiol synthase